jgi:hypothetical protein
MSRLRVIQDKELTMIMSSGFSPAFTQIAEENLAFDRVALSFHAGTKSSLEILKPGFLCL